MCQKLAELSYGSLVVMLKVAEPQGKIKLVLFGGAAEMISILLQSAHTFIFVLMVLCVCTFVVFNCLNYLIMCCSSGETLVFWFVSVNFSVDTLINLLNN